jgi:hypothetical protein
VAGHLSFWTGTSSVGRSACLWYQLIWQVSLLAQLVPDHLEVLWACWAGTRSAWRSARL